MFGRLIKRQPKSHDHGSSAPLHRKTMNPSVIASNMNVLGNIISEGVLDIDGQVDGNVRGHSVTVRPNGRIRGDLLAEEVHVRGIVDGVIKAQSVNLYATAQVKGTILHEYLMVEDGAAVDGKLKRMEPQMLDKLRAELPAHSQPLMDSEVDEMQEEPASEEEIRLLESLRLIS